MSNAPAPAAPRPLSAARIASAAQLACLLEATAPKPGNVSPGRHFADTRYEDFLASAIAIGEPFGGAGVRGVGATVRRAIESTAQWSDANTNLGIVLLFAPLARAALDERGGVRAGSDPLVRLKPDTTSDVVSGFSRTLRAALREVLQATTIDDAREVYAAIRLAAPGGLGRAAEQDVAEDPTMTLLEVMRLAADRDGIAYEYATGFDVTFGTAVPTLERARCDGLVWDDAIVETFLTVLAARPDTHVMRRGGFAMAQRVSEHARRVLAAGGVRCGEGRLALDEMDRALRDPHNTANAGTTADLTAAAVFVMLLAGAWGRREPRGGGNAAAG